VFATGTSCARRPWVFLEDVPNLILLKPLDLGNVRRALSEVSVQQRLAACRRRGRRSPPGCAAVKGPGCSPSSGGSGSPTRTRMSPPSGPQRSRGSAPAFPGSPPEERRSARASRSGRRRGGTGPGCRPRDASFREHAHHLPRRPGAPPPHPGRGSCRIRG
jgi:hypothetical protein